YNLSQHPIENAVMMTTRKYTFISFVASAVLGLLAAELYGSEPNAASLEVAIKSGDFAGYLASANSWLNEKSPAKLDQGTLVTLLNDPVFLAVLDQRQLIAKTGADKLGAFAKADPANQAFLGWLLKNTPAMELYLEGAVPLSLAARDANNYALDVKALEIWERILMADPDSKDGLYLRLAIATALVPPGSINIGAGGAVKPADPVVRYKYYKTAHQKKELFPSFDKLTVWELTHIVSSGASDDDLTWARGMVNNFRPDLRADEMVVNSTSFVWRRASPFPYDNSFKNVLAGGGKCGPRSSWSVMVCHAFGIPAIGVGQPAHACVAYKATNPMTEPQPGSAWKVGFGRGWDVSKLLGMSGPQFLAGIEKRSDAVKFSAVEHLRWLAASLVAADRASSVKEVARTINDSIKTVKTDLTASLKPEEAEAEPGAKDTAKSGAVKTAPVAGSAEPLKALAGTFHIDASSFVKTGGVNSWGGQIPHVLVHDSYSGGKQVYFQQQMKEQWADYVLDVPADGTYEIVMKATCVNSDQILEVCSGETRLAVVPIALSYGLWQETRPVELKLAKGVQTLRVQTPKSLNAENHERGIALRSFDIKAKS
ncbi:MAG: hypothetical protein WCN98_09685, partial [Verrucomicrobiaceae bacterium]